MHCGLKTTPTSFSCFMGAFLPPLPAFPSLLLLFLLLSPPPARPQEPRGHIADLLLRDYAFRCYHSHPRTGHLYAVRFPANLSGVAATTARYRSGSLRRYGARINEFLLAPGTTVRPYVERLIAVRQRLDNATSGDYSATIPGFRLVSPLLGLLFYDGDDLVSRNRPALEIASTRRPISVDFSNFTPAAPPVAMRLCAFWGFDGKVRLSELASPARVCFGYREGHYGLIVEEAQRGERESRWKIVVGSAVGGGLGAALLGLLLVALVKKKKRRLKMEEMERRAYEEEALQVSMVGHVRAPVAGGTRTMPILEADYSP